MKTSALEEVKGTQDLIPYFTDFRTPPKTGAEALWVLGATIVLGLRSEHP
ncbi:hypothetical protein ACE1CI_16715 [Aerosakkonemataceae cyanobacterium BLCC-F50]|uniref:Uncharacterized protein n=1 Tax=Floridaenema flaviceps BLCC-F50 TaxID=3153642 RepID=A0ABV4XS78_9CYAN